MERNRRLFVTLPLVASFIMVAWDLSMDPIAAARIGTETVTYVSNIYKYYIAYKLITEQEAERRKAREALQKKPG